MEFFERLLQMLVCADEPEEKVNAAAATRSAGTNAKWTAIGDGTWPRPCPDKAGFQHFAFEL